MTRDELALYQEHVDLAEALIAAKEAHRAHPTEATRQAVADAKKAAREFCAYWRGIDEYYRPPADGVARTTTVKAKVN